MLSYPEGEKHLYKKVLFEVFLRGFISILQHFDLIYSTSNSKDCTNIALTKKNINPKTSMIMMRYLNIFSKDIVTH